MIKIKLKDGSEYVENDENHIKAISMRMKENNKWIDQFVIAVNYHWENKTIPTKFSENEPWEKEYRNQSELAPDVAYVYLRAILMGLLFNELGGGKVIALNKDGTATEYPSGKKSKEFSK